MLEELKTYADLAYSNQNTIQNTYDLAVRAVMEKVPGDFVECGVAAGSQIGVMGHVLKAFGNRQRKIWAFDSYQGIPMAGKEDDDQPGIGPVDPNRPIPEDPRELLVSSGITVHSLKIVQGNVATRWRLPIEQYVFVEGWFQDTVPISPVKEIAVLRLDGDLYDSTRVCLEHLHPKVSKGGFVIIDDYALTGARKAVHEYLDKIGLKPNIVSVSPEINDVHWYQV